MLLLDICWEYYKVRKKIRLMLRMLKLEINFELLQRYL